jgi:hypothetical protein
VYAKNEHDIQFLAMRSLVGVFWGSGSWLTKVEIAFELRLLNQGDQMRLSKKLPKCIPNRFLSKLTQKLSPVKKVAPKFWLLL